MAPTALVTGASRGIGRRVAEELAKEGYRVLTAVRRPADAPSLQRAEPELLDVASAESIAGLVARLSERAERLDVLVNNAGIYQGSNRLIWDTNVRGPLLVTRGLAPLLKDNARVVLVSSGLAQGAADARLKARFNQLRLDDDSCGRLCEDAPGGYGASKAALNRLAQLFGDLLASRQIKVNAVSPGWVRTDMGGPGAPRSIEQGASSILWGCRLEGSGPTGGFFEDGRALAP